MTDNLLENPFEPIDDVYSVTSLVRETRSLLETEFGSVWVEGEMSNLARPASGHLYFTLKDAQSQVRCALFRGQRSRLKVDPENGMLVRVRARVSLYEPRGDFQLIVSTLEPAGLGELQRQFEKLKLKLLTEGLFEPESKLPLPAMPKRIGVITSPSGAVIHDILTTLKRRFPAIAVTVFPVPVQGADAAPAIVAALERTADYPELDALILARGGGSLEDLWAFNEEIVARAIHDCPVPLVSSIGHETDFTIADFVADVRAPTPTAAAEMLSPSSVDVAAAFAGFESRLAKLSLDKIRMYQQRLDLTAKRLRGPGHKIRQAIQHLEQLQGRLTRATTIRIDLIRARLIPASHRLFNTRPDRRIEDTKNRLQSLATRLEQRAENAVSTGQKEFNRLVRRLNTVNPLETLGRGYAIFYQGDGKRIIDTVEKAKPGDYGVVEIADGHVRCLIKETHDKS